MINITLFFALLFAGIGAFDFSNSALQLEYHTKLKKLSVLNYFPIERAIPIIDSEKSLVYVGTTNKSLYCIDDKTGKIIWERKTSGEILNSVLMVKNALFVANMNGEIYKINRFSGKIIWTYSATNGVAQNIIAINNYIAISDVNDKIYVLRQDTGLPKWSYTRRIPKKFSLFSNSGFLFQNNTLIKGFSDGHVLFFNIKTGDVIKDIVIAQSDNSNFNDINATPVLFGNSIFVISYNSGFAFINIKTGKISYKQTIVGLSSPFIFNGHIYCVKSGNEIVKIEKDKTIKIKKFNNLKIKNVVVANGFILMSTGKALVAYNIETNTILFKISLFYGISAAPKLINQFIYFLSDSGTLFKIKSKQ